jgi:hypothetical protein
MVSQHLLRGHVRKNGGTVGEGHRAVVSLICRLPRLNGGPGYRGAIITGARGPLAIETQRLVVPSVKRPARLDRWMPLAHLATALLDD